MKKAVGIVTLHRSYNLGAVLQAFALQSTIRNLGYSCTIIDYIAPSLWADYLKGLFDSKGHSGRAHNLRVLWHFCSLVRLQRRFDEFRTRLLMVTSQSYRTVHDLARDRLPFDAFVAGSDQIWRPKFDDERIKFFCLDFVSSGRRIAYAPSFGVSKLPKFHYERMTGLIRHFDSLSAREDSGCGIIHELTGRKAEHVLDPTLLLSIAEYDKITIAPPQKGPFILLYPMECSKELLRLARNIRACLKLPIVVVVPVYYTQNSFFKFADRAVRDAGPAEFLGWMKHASMVCTNSFHGIAFSLVYRKNFLSVPHSTMNDRLRSLLECMGLLSRQVSGLQELRPSDPLLGPIDYAPAERRLQEAKDRSMDYLRQALA